MRNFTREEFNEEMIRCREANELSVRALEMIDMIGGWIASGFKRIPSRLLKEIRKASNEGVILNWKKCSTPYYWSFVSQIHKSAIGRFYYEYVNL